MIYRVIGKLHPSLDRLYLNCGIYYEEIGDYYKAYEYFRKWYVHTANMSPGLRNRLVQHDVTTVIFEPVAYRCRGLGAVTLCMFVCEG